MDVATGSALLLIMRPVRDVLPNGAERGRVEGDTDRIDRLSCPGVVAPARLLLRGRKCSLPPESLRAGVWRDRDADAGRVREC